MTSGVKFSKINFFLVKFTGLFFLQSNILPHRKIEKTQVSIWYVLIKENTEALSVTTSITIYLKCVILALKLFAKRFKRASQKQSLG